ncbi:MAG: NADH-quinone oxidoreductase subunit J [Candidatus Didemnitutus sp.]|nr:NADH-quinone oxidoreductase subunit J [Candidatus Didemnitutus sp.]
MTLALILIACVMLGAAAVAMTLRNLIHSALLLVFSWASIAAFYLWAGAQFIAFAQILIYVGAVSMIVLFAMLLTRQGQGSELPIEPASILRGMTALLAGGGVAGVLIGAILGSPLDVTTSAPAAISVKQLGEQLMGPHAAALLVVGIILTVALIGAVVLASVDAVEKPEDIT